MRAYSEDLKRKIVQAVERGVSKAQATWLFGISLSSVKLYARLASQGESLTHREGGRRHPKVDEATKKLLEERNSRGAATHIFGGIGGKRS